MPDLWGAPVFPRTTEVSQSTFFQRHRFPFPSGTRSKEYSIVAGLVSSRLAGLLLDSIRASNRDSSRLVHPLALPCTSHSASRLYGVDIRPFGAEHGRWAGGMPRHNGQGTRGILKWLLRNCIKRLYVLDIPLPLHQDSIPPLGPAITFSSP